MALDARILLEARAGLLGFGQGQLGRRDGLDAVGRQEEADLVHLAGIVACDHQPSALETPRHRPAQPSAARWATTSSAIPLRASVIISRNSASLKGAPSAEP